MAADLLGTPGPGMESFHNTGNGNGDRFWLRNKDEVLLYQTGRSSVFYTVDVNGRWQRNEGRFAGDVERRARDVLEEMRSRSLLLAAQAGEDEKAAAIAAALGKWAHYSDTLGQMQVMAKSACLNYAMVCSPDDDFDAKLDILALPEAVLELSDKAGAVRRPLLPSDMVTFSTGVDYKPEMLQEGAEPALITEYLQTFIPDAAKQRLVFKALGSALLGGNIHRLLIILQGSSGTNGKTQLVEAVRMALGDYAGIGNPSVFRGNLDDKARPDILKLLKKRIAFLAEASKNWELHGDRIKAITGGDGIPLRRMRSDEILEHVPQFTPVIYTNDMPRVNGADRALKRRMLVIDFDQQPEKEDATIKQRFLASVEVREWLLAALVRGHLQALNESVEDVKEAFAELSEEGFNQTSHLGEFFEWLTDSDQLMEVAEADREVRGIKSKYVLMKSMHERYQYWTKIHGNHQDKKDVLNYREFNKQLKDMMGWTYIKNAGMRWDGWILKDSLSSNLTF